MANADNIVLEEFSDSWSENFKTCAQGILKIIPEELLLEFHHIGSTAIDNILSVPIIDVGIMITDFGIAKKRIVPLMEKEGYEYFWQDAYADGFLMFVKRDDKGIRTHHISMAEEESSFWDCLYFREYLKRNPDIAGAYQELKQKSSEAFSHDFKGYIASKSEFIKLVMPVAKEKIQDF